MEAIENILTASAGVPVEQDELELLQQRVQDIPGSIYYILCRYRKPAGLSPEDMAIMRYNYSEEEGEKNLELVFCVSGNRYCGRFEEECSFCRRLSFTSADESVTTVDVAYFRFDEQHLGQLVKDIRTTSFSEDILNFRHTSSFTKLLPLCGKIQGVLSALMNHRYTDNMANIFTNAQTQMLLLHAMECMAGDEPESEEFSCKFLANEEDRKKIELAREVLLQHICEPLTIKELSRKAAINECYLKKGFKELYGTTIFDFFQSQRMEHAKYLLYEKGLTVTDVSNLLGYSSISHFSTAFKKHTGLKPCELLLRMKIR